MVVVRVAASTTFVDAVDVVVNVVVVNVVVVLVVVVLVVLVSAMSAIIIRLSLSLAIQTISDGSQDIFILDSNGLRLPKFQKKIKIGFFLWSK